MKRICGRNADQLRPINITYGFAGFADSSVLYEIGNTKVLCSVTLQDGVPSFLKGKKTGWLTAEYAMLPTATHQRTDRESSSFKRNGRSIEISRLIGRVFRSVINLQALGERTIMIDCDVVQADGSTRTACITGAYFALNNAVDRWVADKKINVSCLKHEIAAVSVGFFDGACLLDIDFSEDSHIDADFTFVMTRQGDLIEVQGTCEKNPISWQYFDIMKCMAQKGITSIFAVVSSKKQQQESIIIPKKIFNPIRFKNQ